MQVFKNNFTDVFAPSSQALRRRCIFGQKPISLSKLVKFDPVRISRSGYSNAFQNTITSKLLENKLLIKLTWHFVCVGQNTSHKVRMSGRQLLHQVVELFFMPLGNSSESVASSLSSFDRRDCEVGFSRGIKQGFHELIFGS
ncbi:hypothetical protein OGATHE_002670 [Ogataea polymorpha]|uniref:Uncharacterized protein n=1 Tax=Ogataea polymorpha TaxID=460523 RepID=A0A9P8T841_9ASCO|nr:hypothetical protein OGATHE_002670 [Ogataea polymorpha]